MRIFNLYCFILLCNSIQSEEEITLGTTSIPKSVPTTAEFISNSTTVIIINSSTIHTTSNPLKDVTTIRYRLNVTTILPTTGLTVTCGVNTTCNVTAVPNETTIGTTSMPTTIKPAVRKEIDVKKQKLGCSCNIQRHICDINCCCDLDCSLEDRRVFGSCKEEENRYYDTRYCDFIQYIYINNTQHEWQVNQNGLFCIVSTNLPASYNLQKKQPLKSYEEAILQKKGRYSWFTEDYTDTIVDEFFNSTSEFIYGSPMYVIRDKRIQHFEIHVNYFTNICNNKEKIFYLENAKSSCSLINVSEDNKQLNLTNYFYDIFVISSPKLLNISRYHGGQIRECGKNVCIPIVAKICDDNFNVCVNVSKPDKRLEISCHFDLIRNTNTCRNVISKIKYNFYHTGTNGIKKVELMAVLNLVKYEFNNIDYEHYVDFEVNFLWLNQTKNYSTILSGSPGYNIGKPILMGNLKNTGNHTHPNLTLIRDPLKYIDNFLVLPKNINGICILNTNVYLAVEFGYNMLTKCRYKGQISKKKSDNATNVCRRIQHDILSNWLISKNVNRSFGLFGNADISKLEEWWPILMETSLNKIFNMTVGNFTQKNRTLFCLNIISGINVDVFHSRVDFEDLINQEKILGITFKFHTIYNTSFVYEMNKTNDFFIDLSSTVMFYDITAHKRKKFVDPPTFEIKLPYDFFYPFIRVHQSSGNKIGISFVGLLVLICTFV